MKKKIIRLVNTLHVIKNNKKVYYNYYTKLKKRIYRCLKDNGFKKIKPIERFQWKLWYNTCYFVGEKENRKVFIKVTGKVMEDVFNNEILVNEYISKESPYLYERLPKVVSYGYDDDFMFIATEYKKMELVDDCEELEIAIDDALKEFTRIGIIHNDFGRINISICDDKYFFIDYGTSLCPNGKIIRFNKSANFINNITEDALKLVDDPDYYYNDAIRVRSKYADINNVNFLVGKDDVYFARLGKNIYKYKLKNVVKNSSSCQLVRED